MNNGYYPEFDVDNLLPLKVAFQGLREDPLWLDRPECWYSEPVKEAIREIWTALRVANIVKREVTSKAVVSVPEGEEQWDMLKGELTKMFMELRAFSADEETAEWDEETNERKSVDVKEKLAAFRTGTSLLGQIVSLGERIANIKAVSDFKARVMKVFDEVLTPEQRTRALERLSQ